MEEKRGIQRQACRLYTGHGIDTFGLYVDKIDFFKHNAVTG